MSLPVLQGERVHLRQLAEADLDPLVAIIQSPGVALVAAQHPDRPEADALVGADRPLVSG